MDKEELEKSLSRVSFMLKILHVCGILQMYFLIPAVLTGSIVGIIIGVVLLIWLSFETAKYQYAKKSFMAEYEKKYGNKE